MLFHSDLHAATYCLDPEFRGARFEQQTHKDLMSSLKSACTKLLGDERGIEAFFSYVGYKQGRGIFFDANAHAAAETMSGADWWYMCGSFMCDPTTSAPLCMRR